MSYLEERLKRKQGIAPALETKKPKKYLNKVSPKRQKELNEGRGDDEIKLDRWFDEKMEKSLKVCENCWKSLKSYNQSDWRGSQHHVLDKALYPSVKSNPLNHLVLGKWCCHHVWHVSWEKAAKMRIFPKAIDIITILYPFLTREEKAKLPDIVIQEIKPKIYNK